MQGGLNALAMRTAGIGLVVVAALATDARATGLVCEWEDGRAAIMALDRLEVTAAVGDATAVVTARRVYSGAIPADEVAPADVRFYQTLDDARGETIVDARLNGELLVGTVLLGEDADAARRQLVTAIHDPAPLREMGKALFVSEPLPDLGLGWELTIETASDLGPRGTMRGLAIAGDWYRGDAGVIDIVADVATEAPLRAVYSPYHELALQRPDPTHAVGSHVGYGIAAWQDVTILVSTGDEPYHLDLLPFRYSDKDGGFLMALLTPDATPPEGDVVPRDIVLVLDRSGSMQGEKIVQARAALNDVLGGLRAQDHFAVVAFDEFIDTYKADAVAATPAEVTSAQEFVNAIEADGATNVDDALASAFSALPVNKGNPRYIVLLTDGQPTAGETDMDSIVANAILRNEVGARIFSFGIGDDVNTTLLERLAKESSGDVLYIRPGQSVETAVASFFAQLQDPLLGNPVLDFSAFGITELYPTRLPDLFAGQTVSILGRYDAPGTAQVVLHGVRSGTSDGHSFDVTLPAYAVDEGYVPRVWATRHVGTVLHDVKLTGNQALVDEALDTARRFGIVTEFTYYTTDDDGTSDITYSDVPEDQNGSKAVATSSSLDGYEKEEGASSSTLTDVRYWRDRVFPVSAGWYTDTTILDPPAWIDLQFGSSRYFELAANEIALGTPGLLSVATNVRFESFGRYFRVTDADDPPPEAPQIEAGVVPVAVPPSTGLTVAVAYVGDLTAEEVEIFIDRGGLQNFQADTGGSCSGSGSPLDLGWGALGALGYLAFFRRRLRA